MFKNTCNSHSHACVAQTVIFIFNRKIYYFVEVFTHCDFVKWWPCHRWDIYIWSNNTSGTEPLSIMKTQFTFTCIEPKNAKTIRYIFYLIFIHSFECAISSSISSKKICEKFQFKWFFSSFSSRAMKKEN